MSIVVRFHSTSGTLAQYDEVLRREREMPTFPPAGRESHVCFGSDGDVHVSEIWDSVEELQAYGPLLMPILSDVGIELAGPPEVFAAHSVIQR